MKNYNKTQSGLPFLKKEDVLKILDKAYSKKIGVLLVGPTGNGKTTIFNEWTKNKGFVYLTMQELVNKYDERGNKIFKQDLDNTENNKIQEALNGIRNIYIDDIGAETNLNYGKGVLFNQIFEHLYSKNGIIYGTTNLNLEQLEEIYGDRTWSRLQEKTLIIVLDAPNYRKENKITMSKLFDSIENEEIFSNPPIKKEIKMDKINQEYEEFKIKKIKEMEEEEERKRLWLEENRVNEEDLLEFYDNEEMEDPIKIMKIYKSFNSQSLSYN